MLLVLLQLFLTNLENILKFDILVTKSEDHQSAKILLQVVSIHVSRLLCCWHSWDTSESLSIIKQNVAVHIQLVDKLDIKAKLYQQFCIVHTCAGIWCKMNVFIRNICKRINIWSCKEIFECEKSLHVSSAFRPFSYPEKEYKRVLE